MTPTTFAPGFESRLECFLHHVGEELPRSDQWTKFALDTLGLLREAERKSVEPLAAPTRPEAPDAAHQAMLHFVAAAPWEDRPAERRDVYCMGQRQCVPSLLDGSNISLEAGAGTPHLRCDWVPTKR